jgi:tetratricopeptide (TPR) repeat protein
MPIPAIAPSPIARLLLELAERGASGGVDTGGRRLVMTKGSIVEVRPAADDSSLGDFLIAAGRLSAEDLAIAKKQMSDTRTALEVVLRQRELVPIEVLLETRRALWLDRFVRGIASDEAEGKQPSMLTPEPHAATGPAIATLPFVLDALARRAGFGDAEQVGRSAKAWFDWLPTPIEQRAREWADFGEVKEAIPVSALFARHPAAPSRIAALVRAGLARLSEARPSIPPPDPRPSVIASPAARPVRTETSGSIAPPADVLVTMLEPGGASTNDRPIGIEPVENWFPAAGGQLEDPLDPLERQIASLEQAGSAPEERARAWLALGRAMRSELDSLEEAARAAREAASADPSNVTALETAAELCGAVGKPELAHAYALAAAEELGDDPKRAATLVLACDFALRAGKSATALKHLKSAIEAAPNDPQLVERLARQLAARGDTAGAVRSARTAADRYRATRPEAAAAILGWAVSLAPHDPDVLTEYASALASHGLGEAASAALLRAARRETDHDVRRRLYVNAALRAELAARPDLGADAFLEAFDVGAGARGQHEALLNDLGAIGATVEIAVLGVELASHALGEERSKLLTRAADARLEMPGEPHEAVELFTRALIADPRNARALDAITQLSQDERTRRKLSDALERTLRSEELDAAAKLKLLPSLLSDLNQAPSAPLLERWLWALSAHLGGPGPREDVQRDLESRIAGYEQELRSLEQELRGADTAARTEAGFELALRMRDDPGRRGKARKLLEKIVELEPTNKEARRALVSLMRLQSDGAAVCVMAEVEVGVAHTSLEKVSAELALVRALFDAGQPERALDACHKLLEHAPKNREAVLWLSRLAQRAGDPLVLREARIRRAEAALDPRERARALAQLAHLCLSRDEIAEALGHAEAALAADPRCAEAAFMLLQHVENLPRNRAATVLRMVRGVLGDVPEVLGLLSRASYGSRDAHAQLEALEAHARVAPFDPGPFLGLVALRSTGRDEKALRDAVLACLQPERTTAATQEAVMLALERLFQLGHKQQAAALAVRAIDALGERAELLVEWSEPLVDEIEDAHLGAAILERGVARATPEQKVDRLRRVAHFHRERAAMHAEARAYLRLLASIPSDADALERLAFIYASTGETGRLMSVLTLRLELATNRDDRRARLIELALASLTIGKNADGAKDLLRAALGSEEEAGATLDPPLELLRRGIGLLLASEDPQAAFDLLLELSESASPERAAVMIEEAISVAETFLHNPDLALRAATLGLEGQTLHTPFLLHFERLALELGDVATGREVYRHLAENSIGIHGRRAVLYRGARWLERAGALPDALDLAERAFLLSPSEGAVFTSLERVARGVGQHVAVLRALLALAEQSTRAERKAQLYLRAAILCDDELREPERAMELYEHSYRERADDDTERRAMTCLKRLREAAPNAATHALARWRELQEERLREAWSSGIKIGAQLSLSRLHLDELGAVGEAEAYVLKARAELDAAEDIGAEHKQVLAAQIATMLGRIPDDGRRNAKAHTVEAPKKQASTLVERPHHGEEVHDSEHHIRSTVQNMVALQRATRALAEAPVEPTPPHNDVPALPPSKYAPNVTKSRARVTEPSLSSASGGSHAAVDMRNTQRGFQFDMVRQQAAVTHVSAVQANDTNAEEILRRPPQSGAPDDEVGALQRLVDEARGDAKRSEKLCETLLQRARTHPLSVTLVRALRQLGEDSGRAALAQVSSEILAHVAPSQRSEPAPQKLDPSADAVKLALLEARDDGELSPLFTILAHVSQGAGPLFRKPLSAFGVSANDFVPAREDGDALGSALYDVSQLLTVSHETYLSPTPDDRVQLVSTNPFAIVIGAGCPHEPAALRFRLARSFEHARPSSALLSALSQAASDTLIEAVRAAFGPTDGKNPPVPREAAALAAELWRTMPSGTQRQVANLYRVAPRNIAPRALSQALQIRAARIGLVACGSVDVALEALHLDISYDAVPRNEAAFDAMCRDDALLASLLRFALSDAYLILREAI